MVDCVYIAANSRDIRFTRICVASVREFYPDVEIRILQGGPISFRILRELELHWGVRPAEVVVADYGWGFVKLEPLFGPPGERFLMMDSDTVMTGPVLDGLSGVSGQFIVDYEEQTAERASEIYLDSEGAAAAGIELPTVPIYFNTGQWVGSSGLIDRLEFEPFLDWTLPRNLKLPNVFKNGEQGILNYVLNQGAACGRFRINRVGLMRWPGHGMDGLSAIEVNAGSAPVCIIHWAGMKRIRHATMPGADLLNHFERSYYQRIPAGAILRHIRAGLGTVREVAERIQTHARLFWEKKIHKRFDSGRC